MRRTMIELAFFFVLATFLFASCSLCRDIAIRDAKVAVEQGKEARIIVYEVGVDGLIAGMGMWRFHAQAQMKNEKGEWEWTNGRQDYSHKPGGRWDVWDPSVFESVVKIGKLP
jgi:hypothetical protein